ncbi:hypothetical protein GQX73_g805 [Xylaria multiplex]|uniref:Uncharacterized protein n=1 Tax=Xylaria multiplex TaxID=323545 RepID=A0A7C8N061_9PEZI|nr:hypothetical protein GQX73_g805 [Xylaria multiplex]
MSQSEGNRKLLALASFKNDRASMQRHVKRHVQQRYGIFFRESSKAVNLRLKSRKTWKSILHRATSPSPKDTGETQSARRNTAPRENVLEDFGESSRARNLMTGTIVALQQPSPEASTESQGLREDFLNPKLDPQGEDLAVEKGTVVDSKGSLTSAINAGAESPDIDAANENKDHDLGPGANPELVQIDVEDACNTIFHAGKSIYFSTSYCEASDLAMFNSARATLDRLQPDLEPIVKTLGRKSRHTNLVTFELRMAGKKEEGSTKITLRPSVWIRCCDKSTCKAIERRLSELDWLDSAYYSPVYVRGNLKLASAGPYPRLTELDLNHGTSFWTDTPDGRLQKKVHVHHLCRIGGYIIVDLPTGPQLAAVTTGHGLLEYWVQQNSHQEAMSSTTEVAEARKIEDTGSEDETQVEGSDTEAATHHISNEGDLVIDWEPAELFADNINFIFQASPTQEGSFEVKTGYINADFLLLSGENQTIPGSSLTMKKAIEQVSVDSHMIDADMSSDKFPGMVITARSEAHIAAEIFPDIIPLFINGVMFQTRKVQLSELPYSGLSGSWIVHDRALCGVIIAIYEGEPFALMLTAEKLLSDIAMFSSNNTKARVATELDEISCLPCEYQSNTAQIEISKKHSFKHSIRDSIPPESVHRSKNILLHRALVKITQWPLPLPKRWRRGGYATTEHELIKEQSEENNPNII